MSEALRLARNPDVETTDWKARRGKTAHRVRREGTVKAVSYPYPVAPSGHLHWSAFALRMTASARTAANCRTKAKEAHDVVDVGTRRMSLGTNG